MPSAEKSVSLDIADRTNLKFGDSNVEVRTAPAGSFIDVRDALLDPSGFHGSPLVDQVVRFHGTFSGLIGADTGRWEPENLHGQGIVVLEHHFAEAASLMEKVNRLAQRIIADPRLYDDPVVAGDYHDLAKAGYDLLLSHQDHFGFPVRRGIPVSLERAGLVTTRLAHGLSSDALVPDEVRVVTKRTQLVGDKDTDLSVTVKWRNRRDLTSIAGRTVELADFVNPASGASGAAFVLAAQVEGAPILQVNHRSISLTRQGVRYIQEAFGRMGVWTTFYSVGECTELNDHYYLSSPNRAVADAGHILRHKLPAWYSQ